MGSLPLACSSSKDAQLPIDSGKVRNLLPDTFRIRSCTIKALSKNWSTKLPRTIQPTKTFVYLEKEKKPTKTRTR